MRQHDALGLAGAAGRMHEDGRAFRLRALDQRVAQAWVRGQSFGAFGLHRFPRDQAGIGVGIQSARVVIDDVFDRRALIAQIEDLVDLLLVFRQHEARARLMHKVADFVQRRVRERRHRITVERARREHAGIQPRPVVAEHQHHFAGAETQALKPGRACKSRCRATRRQVVSCQMPLFFSRIATRSGNTSALRASTRTSVVSAAKSQVRRPAAQRAACAPPI